MNKESLKRKLFTEVYETHWLMLYLHLLKMLDDENEAKDVLQEVFTSLWNNFDTISIRKSFGAYLFSAVRNRAINVIGHKKVVLSHQKLQTVNEAVYSPAPDSILIEKELALQITNEIDRLPPKMAVVFRKSRLENKSYKEIAEELNIAENTVKKQVSRALQLVREKLLHIKYYLLFL